MWLDGLPVVWIPSWQLAQFPLMPAWPKEATTHVVVLWQSSHRPELEMWFVDFPVAWTPLWQLAQFPVTPAWLNPAVCQDVVL